MEMFLNTLLLSWVNELDDVYVEAVFPERSIKGLKAGKVEKMYVHMLQACSLLSSAGLFSFWFLFGFFFGFLLTFFFYFFFISLLFFFTLSPLSQ